MYSSPKDKYYDITGSQEIANSHVDQQQEGKDKGDELARDKKEG